MPYLKTQRYRPNLRRLECPPVVILVVLILFLDPDPDPAFDLDVVSDRTIYSDAIVFTAKAKANSKDTSRKHLRMTKPIPS